MNIPWRSIKLGWYVLAFLFLYSFISTISLINANVALGKTRQALEAQQTQDKRLEPPVASSSTRTAPPGLWFPIPGASLPQEDAYLPGSARPYRNGVSQGFDFYSGDAGIPIAYGTPIIASESGVAVRVDQDYVELTPEAWDVLLENVSEGATEEQLDQLRGRQVWIRTEDGRTLRYAHLSATRPGLASGQEIYRGQVIGYVGNSGTDDGINGTTARARLHFEIWNEDGTYFGENLDPDSLRLAASSLFVGP